MAKHLTPSFAATEERDVHIALYTAMGKTQVEIGLLLGLSQQAVARRVSVHRAYHERMVAFVRASLVPYVQAVKESWDIKQQNRDKGHRVVGKILDQALVETKKVVVKDRDGNQTIEEIEVEPNLVHLKAAEAAVERVEGKSLDRKAILELSANVTDATIRQVDGGKLDEILDEVRKLNELRAPELLMLSGATEAELVNESDRNAN